MRLLAVCLACAACGVLARRTRAASKAMIAEASEEFAHLTGSAPSSETRAFSPMNALTLVFLAITPAAGWGDLALKPMMRSDARGYVVMKAAESEKGKPSKGEVKLVAEEEQTPKPWRPRRRLARILRRAREAVMSASEHQGRFEPTRTKGPTLICHGLNEFLHPTCHAFRGLLVQRPQEPRDIQSHVDELVNSGVFEQFGRGHSIQEKVELTQGKTEHHLSVEFSQKARRLASLLVQHGLPADVGSQIEKDFQQIGLVLAKLVPTAKQALLKLEFMGEGACVRWHRDNYVGRAVITYNSKGTQYVHQDDITWTGEPFVQDERNIFTANVGDILFMKGIKYPAIPDGLVHRSPPICWHPDGAVVNRLLLKVDLD